MMICVTGANGFVGRYVLDALLAAGQRVRACVRRTGDLNVPGVDIVGVRDVIAGCDWSDCVEGADVVLHIAGAAHGRCDKDPQRELLMRRINIDASVSLAAASVAAGCRRVVFVSSIGVNGAHTSPGETFTIESRPAPQDFYAWSKLEAERQMREVCESGDVEFVVVRPTLVAGAGAPGNLERLARFIRKGRPIPLVGENRRQLVGARSLADLLVLASSHPRASGNTFLAADEPALSMSQIVTTIGEGMGVKPRLLRLPVQLVRPIAKMLGRGRDLDRMQQSLLIDASAAREIIGWGSSVSILDELRAVGRAYVNA